MQYYLEREQSGYVGNCLLWWRSGHCGYTCDLADAADYGRDGLDYDAVSVCGL